MGDIGYQFQPGVDQRRMLQGVNQGGQLSPLANEALKILSLRLPSVLGGAPISPDALLRSKMSTMPLGAGGPPPPAGLPTAGSGAPTPFGAVNFSDPNPAAPSTGFPSPSGPSGAPTIIPGGGSGPRAASPPPAPGADIGDILRRIGGGGGYTPSL